MEAEFQKICDGILALMDKNLIPSARRIAGTEGHQQRTPKRSSSSSKSILNRSQESDRQHRKPRTTRILGSRGCIEEYTAQRKVVAWEEQQKLVKKSWEDQAVALTVTHVEEKQVAEIKNKVQTVKISHEVTNSSIKQTQSGHRRAHR